MAKLAHNTDGTIRCLRHSAKRQQDLMNKGGYTLLQPMTAKELEYVADSMSNEDMLMKECAAVVAASMTPAIRNCCTQMIAMHQQHYDSLMHAIEHHQQMAPTQPQ